MSNAGKPLKSETGRGQEVTMFDVEENEVIRNKRSIPWSRLEEGLHANGCPLCEIVENACRRHIHSLLYEYVNDVSVRKKLHASFGFCNHHSWLATDIELEMKSDGQHLGTLHESLIKAELRHLKEVSTDKRITRKKKEMDPAVQTLLKRIVPEEMCLLCSSSMHTEEFYASQFVLMSSDKDFRSLFEIDAILLCRPHFLSIMRETRDKLVVDYFLNQQIMKLERLNDQLNLFLDKHDVRFQHEPRGIEQSSWLKVLEHFSCKRGVDRLWGFISPSQQ